MTRLLVAALLLLPCAHAAAKKITLNPSDQSSNPVAGGGNEAQYALINAKLAKTILVDHGYAVTVDQDFYNAPKNANSWGANIFISIHTNAGGGHGIETLYLSSGGKSLAGKVQKGLLDALPYQDRGLKLRTDLHVLNATNMVACLTECLFHDCSKSSGYAGHPPSEASFLKSADGQKKIARGIAAGACAYLGSSCDTSAPPPPSKGFLKGSVYKAPNLNDRLGGATVKLSNGQSAKADANGAWSFELVPGSYTVTASAAGFKAGTAKGTVTAGKDTWLSVGLEADAPAPAAPADAGVDPSPDAAVEQDGGALDGASGDDAIRPRSPRPEEGCSCRLSGAGAAPDLLLPILALVLALARRGRRALSASARRAPPAGRLAADRSGRASAGSPRAHGR
jgi:N-acetylmuramoyl-L-alanine amidase